MATRPFDRVSEENGNRNESGYVNKALRRALASKGTGSQLGISVLGLRRCSVWLKLPNAQ